MGLVTPGEAERKNSPAVRVDILREGLIEVGLNVDCVLNILKSAPELVSTLSLAQMEVGETEGEGEAIPVRRATAPLPVR